jgi:hypothetical protein
VRRHGRSIALLVAGFVLGAIAVGGAIAAHYETSDGTEVTAIKITGGGLPDLGASEVYGVAELPSVIRDYHDSGRYEDDLAKVDGLAKRSLRNQLRRLRESPGPGKYSECHRRGEHCKKVRPAIVLDIDETSLSNYAGLDAANFSAAGRVPGAVAGNDPVIAPTLQIYRFARERSVKAFFITGRPEALRTPTETNLQTVGFDRGYRLIMEPVGEKTIPFKSGARAAVERDGFTILVNVGDQDSDLAGGHARRAFKLPNPIYFIP